MSHPTVKDPFSAAPPLPAIPAGVVVPAGVSPETLLIAQTIAQAIVAGMAAAAPPRKLSVDEVDQKTAFNPTGKRNRKLPVNAVFQNGAQLFEHLSHDEEIKLIGMLKPGRYISNIVSVEFKDHDGLRDVHINYKCGTIGDRMMLKNYWRSFTELLKLCVEEASAKDATKQ